MRIVNMQKPVINGNVCYVEYGDTNLKELTNLMHAHPLFSDHQIYLYQVEKRKTLKVVSRKMGRRALFLAASYEPSVEAALDERLE